MTPLATYPMPWLNFTTAAVDLKPEASAAASLTDRAVLARLTVRAASDSYTHRPASQELTEAKHAKRKAARVVVQLWPDSMRHKEVQAARRELYAVHREHSLPWLDDGARIVAVPALSAYEAALDVAQDEYRAAFEDMAVFYADELTHAEKALGDQGLFDRSRYPEWSGQWSDEHGAERTILPMPNVADLRLDVPAAQLEAYRAQAETTLAAVMADARRDLFERLHAPLAKMADALSDPEKVYRDTLMGNLAEAAAILPLLDPDQDPTLTQLAAEASMLAAVDPDRCREDPQARSQTAATARALARQVGNLAAAL